MDIFKAKEMLSTTGNISLSKIDTIADFCPHCGANISVISLKDNELNYELWKDIPGDINRYSYDDGDNLQVDEKSIGLSDAYFDASFMQGRCRNCNKLYYSAFLDYCNLPLDNEECGLVLDPDIKVYDKLALYEVKLQDEIVGYAEKYIGGNFNGMTGVYHRFAIGPFPLDADMAGEYGVSLHFSTDRQSEAYYLLRDVSVCVINQIIAGDLVRFSK